MQFLIMMKSCDYDFCMCVLNICESVSLLQIQEDI